MKTVYWVDERLTPDLEKKSPGQRMLLAIQNSFKESEFARFHEFFPCGSAQESLKLSDALTPAVPKEFPENRVIGNSQLTTFVGVLHMNHLDAISKNGHTLSFQ